MTKEYIEREALLELVEYLSKYENCKNCYHLPSCDAWVRNATRLYNDYEYSVEKCPYYIPVADVEPVQHGKWLDEDSFDAHYQPIYKCSECNKTVADNYITFHKFCLHCGAKMDGGNSNG